MTPEAAAVSRLCEALSLPPAVCALLCLRGFDDPEAAKAYLRPVLDGLTDPFDMVGMEPAVERILNALRDGETLLVHGDYDADGISGAALLTRWLTTLGARVEAWVPDRKRHGYDFGPGGIEAAEASGATLVVTVDCGIRAHEAVARAREKGIDVIVTDHHAPGQTLPDAVAVVDPNREDCPSGAGSLCGTGVAYALCRALARERGLAEEELHAHLDLVALATVADLVPMEGENRILVRYGLRAFRRTAKPGLQALVQVAGLASDEVDSGHLGYALAPRINAAGRVGTSMSALRLLLTEDPSEARALARELDDANRRRRSEDRRIEDEALGLLARCYDPGRDYGVVLASEGWHPGVIGIVASRLVDRIHRPVVLVALDGGTGRGSARSIRGYSLADAFERCSGHLSRFGGHAMAAGMDIEAGRLDAFRAAFAEDARERLAGTELHPELRIDGELGLPDASDELHRYLEYFGPFGIGNRRPVWMARGVRSEGTPREVGRGHLKLSLSAEGSSLEAIGFGLVERIPPSSLAGRDLDVAFQLRENVYRGRRTLQARILDIRAAAGRP